MKTIKRLIYQEIYVSVAFSSLAFLALFFFFDFVEELKALGQAGTSGYQLTHALTYVVLLIPSHLYELLPITVLIGTIFVMARLAQSSEFTILRTSGLGPWRALRTLLWLGLGFVLLTFAIGDYLAPWADRSAQLLKARFQGNISIGQTGAWLKEKQRHSQYTANIGALDPNGHMRQIRIFELDSRGFLISMMDSKTGQFAPDDAWLLQQVERTEFSNTGNDKARIERTSLTSVRWPTQISAEMVSAALLKPERMKAIDLYLYIRHLAANDQSAQRYEIAFWKKVFYPLSCLVMVVLALPFAYLHFRSGSISGYVFGGVMAGISFFLLNNLFGHIGNLQNWQPWLSAALPGLIYTGFSLSAFAWLVLRR